jgi:hypothetical protein
MIQQKIGCKLNKFKLGGGGRFLLEKPCGLYHFSTSNN